MRGTSAERGVSVKLPVKSIQLPKYVFKLKAFEEEKRVRDSSSQQNSKMFKIKSTMRT